MIIQRSKAKRKQNKVIIIEILVMFVCVLYIVLEIVAALLFYNDSTYPISSDYVKKNAAIQQQLGEVKSISCLAGGSIQKEEDTKSHLSRGTAEINLLVKGSKSFAEVSVKLKKEVSDKDWVILSYQYK